MPMFTLAIISAVAVTIATTIGLHARVLSVPGQISNIQLAIDTSRNGDTILVEPGSYVENINFHGKKVIVTSRYLLQKEVAFIYQTVIDGKNPPNPQRGSTVTFNSHEDSTSMLYGFTIINGIGSEIPGSYAGGGIYVDSASSPTILYNIVRNNSALRGGGIAIRNTNINLLHNVIFDNHANRGGGISISNSTVAMSHNVIYANWATLEGGGVRIVDSEVTFRSNLVALDTAQYGGGIYCSTSVVTVEHCDFYQNNNGHFVGCPSAGFGDTTAGLNFNRIPADSYMNIFRNPQLTNVAAYDFRSSCSSPLIDAGFGIPESYPIGGIRSDIGTFEYSFRAGDLNNDKKVNLVDATAMVNVIFYFAPFPCPLYIADLNCDRRFNIADIISLVGYLAGYSLPCVFNPNY